MGEQVFMEKFAEVLEVTASEGIFNEDYKLNGAELWDSMGILSAIALIDEEFGITLPAKTLEECNTVRDLLALIRDASDQTKN